MDENDRRLNLPCDSCVALLTAMINRPLIASALTSTDGFLFHFCQHHQVHCCWSIDGHLGLQFCESDEHAGMISDAYIACGAYHRAHLAQLLASELVKYTPRPSDANRAFKPRDGKSPTKWSNQR